MGTTVTTRSRARAVAATKPWQWQHYMAVAGAVCLLWGGWTIVAWIGAGPHQVTAFRDHGDFSWTAARLYEAAALLMSVIVGTLVVRGCRRQRRLTWDGQLCIAGLLVYWVDPLPNFYQPIVLYSSQWFNVTNWCSQTPFVVNTDCGRMPEAVAFLWPVYTFGLLAAAMIGCWVLRRVTARWPDISFVKLVWICAALGAAIDMAMEIPIIRIGLWRYAAFPDALSLFGGEFRYPIFEALVAIVFFAPVFLIRHFKDDRGRTVFERGLDHLSPTRRTALSLMSTIGLVQVLVIIGCLILIPIAPYTGPFPEYPAHLVNGMCDNGEFTKTRYGPCPGSPGYEAPIRHLPGQKPPAG